MFTGDNLLSELKNGDWNSLSISDRVRLQQLKDSGKAIWGYWDVPELGWGSCKEWRRNISDTNFNCNPKLINLNVERGSRIKVKRKQDVDDDVPDEIVKGRGSRSAEQKERRTSLSASISKNQCSQCTVAQDLTNGEGLLLFIIIPEFACHRVSFIYS